MNEIEFNVEMTAENSEENIFQGEVAGACCTCCECGSSGGTTPGGTYVPPHCP